MLSKQRFSSGTQIGTSKSIEYTRIRALRGRDQFADRCLELSSEGHRRLFPERQPRCKNGCPERHLDSRTLHEVRDPHVIRTLIEGRNKWNAGVKRDHGGTALKRNTLIAPRPAREDQQDFAILQQVEGGLDRVPGRHLAVDRK